MSKSNLLNLLGCFLICILALTTYSCSDDPVRGCTNSESNNFNADATEDDGSCSFDRDIFLGDYIGDFACPGVLAGASTEGLMFTIAPPVDPDNNTGALITFNSGIITGLSVEGDVSGNQLNVPFQEMNGFPFMGFTVDLNFTGSFTIDGNDLDGELVINIVTLQQEDTCTMDAVKQ